jgi:hypothetical protein
VNARDRAAIARGVSVAVLGIVLLRGLPAGVRRYGGWRERVLSEATLARRSRAAVAGESATRDSLGIALHDFVGLAPRLLAGRTHAEAAATLVSWVTGAASGGALRVRRAESVADSGQGTLRRVRVRAELEGDIAGVTRFIGSVERGNPLLSVTTMAITAPDPSARPGAAEVLRLEVTIAGWYVGGTEDR